MFFCLYLTDIHMKCIQTIITMLMLIQVQWALACRPSKSSFNIDHIKCDSVKPPKNTYKDELTLCSLWGVRMWTNCVFTFSPTHILRMCPNNLAKGISPWPNSWGTWLIQGIVTGPSTVTKQPHAILWFAVMFIWDVYFIYDAQKSISYVPNDQTITQLWVGFEPPYLQSMDNGLAVTTEL